MTKNSRLSFALAVILLLAGAALRAYAIGQVPLGLNQSEIVDLRLTETVRQGSVQVFFALGEEGRETLYPAVIAGLTSILGTGTMVFSWIAFAIGMITLALAYALGRRLYGDLAGLAALGFLAVTWWPVLLSRSIGRETVLPLLVISVLLALAMGLPVYGPRRPASSQTAAFAGLGVAVAVGIYLHPSGLVVGLLTLGFVGFYMAFGRPRLTDSIRRSIGFTALLVVIFIVPYLLSAMNLPHLSGAVRLFSGLTSDPTPVWERAFNGVMGLGLNGDSNPAVNIPGRPFTDPVSALIVLLGAVVALRYLSRRLRYTLLAIGLLVLGPLVLFAPNSPSWIASSILIPILALCFGLGITALGALLRRRVAAGLILASLLIFNFGWTFQDLIFVWPELPEVRSAYNSRIAEQAMVIDRSANDIPTLLCSTDFGNVRASTDFSSTRLLALMLNNRSAPLRALDCASGLVFPNGGAKFQLISPNRALLNSVDPSVTRWFELADGAARGILQFSIESQLAELTGLFTTAAPIRLEPDVSVTEDVMFPPLRMENNLTFLGYETVMTRVQPGGILPVVTYWRVDGMLPPDLVVFSHLYGDLGAAPLANIDSISMRPTSLAERDVFMQVHLLRLPETLPEREYDIAVGAYRTQSSQRLQVLLEPDQRPAGTRLILYSVEVTSNP
ncbi:MAG: glycosyltransferase family 39 protein [Chloroflexi bacterium]|nr:glycosyltransferase family 39 protein [Chloroflexota bacterium]